MKPVRTPDTNATFVLEGCFDLPATKAHDAQGNSYVESAWELTPEELETLNKTGRLYVCTMGTLVPPISLSIESHLMKEGDTDAGSADDSREA